MSADAGAPAAGFRIRSVAPDLPAPERFLPYLQSAYAAAQYSNFGPLARRLEQELAQACGAPGEVCVTASSATSALSAALLAFGGDGPVALPAFTFPASLGAIRAAGRRPRVMDVSAQTWAVDPEALERVLEDGAVAAVMLVAPFGLACDFDPHLKVCAQRGVPVVIDNAAGLGLARPRRPATPGVCEVFSMHATKPFGVGEGGVAFAHPQDAERMRAALNFALARPEGGPTWGFNGKLSELHAAVGLAQLARFDDRLRGRQAFAGRYLDALKALPEVAAPEPASRASWQIFPVLMPDAASRARALDIAREAGLELRRYYHPSLSLWPGEAPARACPAAEDLAERMLVLPVRSWTGEAEAQDIVRTAVGALRRAIHGDGI